MTLFFILLLLALIVGGYYVYQRLLTMEREIRAAQYPPDEVDSPVDEADIPSSAVASADADSATGPDGIMEEILMAVGASPGLSQAEIYTKFPNHDRRELQRLLRELDQAGRVRREKQGSSYRLYPL